MNAKEPTWFVRIQGHTLGPLTTDELKASVREGEIGPSDKLAVSGANEWQTLEDHSDLLAYWKSFHKPALSFSLPSPKILWKKKTAPPEPAPTMEPAPEIEAKKAEPVLAIAPPVKAVSAPKPKAAKPKKSKPAKKTKAALKAKKNPVPQPAKEEILEAEPVLVEVPEKIESVFPERPPVPDLVVHIPEVPKFSPQPESRKKNFRIAAIVAAALAVILGVAGIAYWAGQKTRDLKEFPLPDPSSPTSQPSTAGDPVLPLRAPTRPQRD